MSMALIVGFISYSCGEPSAVINRDDLPNLRYDTWAPRVHRNCCRLLEGVAACCRGAYCVMAHDAVRALTAEGLRAVRLTEGMLEWRLADLPVAV